MVTTMSPFYLPYLACKHNEALKYEISLCITDTLTNTLVELYTGTIDAMHQFRQCICQLPFANVEHRSLLASDVGNPIIPPVIYLHVCQTDEHELK
jgi:hypothetical protein